MVLGLHKTAPIVRFNAEQDQESIEQDLELQDKQSYVQVTTPQAMSEKAVELNEEITEEQLREPPRVGRCEPLSPPPSLRKRCLRGTSPHVESEGIRGASNPGSSSSEEPDDSNDEDWSTAESAEEDEEVTVDSGGDDSGEEDISINLIECTMKCTRVQQYQWFGMDASKPGMVECRKSPSADADEQDLRRKVDGILTENTKVARMFEHFLEPLPVPGVNTEKKYTMHYVVRPYVPEEFRGDEIYAAFSNEQDDSAKAAMQSRRQHRAAMALPAKENLDQRGCGVQEEEDEDPVAKKKPRKSVRVQWANVYDVEYVFIQLDTYLQGNTE
ncbi:hypothetical protein PR002_g1014 [Phytophthora rubi]|uniref:Uncharacterized protein n=1 Tax=Phytophthora rubi TaxID=129364 RepID=A0A6A3NSE1_9STRA|nr:hypothetical protein PR002_g1014 [Phytophthora rubi]